MRNYYSNGIDRERIKQLNITKEMIYGFFTHPKDSSPISPRKKHASIDWCTYEPWRQNWMNYWFMVFNKPPCNNGEVPLYFLHQLWVEFVWVFHVNYFDINEFHGVGLGSSQDRQNPRRNPLRGPPPPRRVPNHPLDSHLSLSIDLRTLVLPYHVLLIVYYGIVHMLWHLDEMH